MDNNIETLEPKVKASIDWSNSNKYFDITKIDSHNKTLNFILSGRGSGKTVRMKKKLFDGYEKKGLTFVWVVRSDFELEHEFFETFFTHFEDIEHNYYWKGRVLKDKRTDRNVALFASMTNINRKIRKIHLLNCANMVFDEFILDPTKAREKYKQKEVDDFMNAYETISRNYDYKTKMWFLGNPIVLANPYFISFKVDVGKVRDSFGKVYIPNEDTAVYYFPVPEIVLDKKNESPYGRLAQLMEGRFYESVFQSEEQFITNVTIEKKIPEGYKLISQIKAQGMQLYFYTTGQSYYVTDFKSTEEKHPYYFTFDIGEWDGKDITVIDSTNPVRTLFRTVFGMIRRNAYSVSSENVHYVVRELVGLLK